MSYVLILFVSGQAYLTLITGWIVVVNYTLIFIGIYTRQGILTNVLVCQSLMVFFPIDKWLGRFRAVRLLFPIILATFAGLFLKPHSPLTIALWFFMAGYELDMHEKLRQSFREVRNPLVHIGIIKTIERLYKERKIGWTLKVFWLISFVNALPEVFIKKELKKNENEISVFFSTTSNNILQYLALFLVSVDVAGIVVWTVEAILKWSVRHRVDAIETGELDNVFSALKINFVYVSIYIFLLPQPCTCLYRHGALVYLDVCRLIIVQRALKLCNETLQILSTSLLENIWAHVRAISLTFLLGLLIYMSWPKLFIEPLYSYLIADALVQTLKTLTVYMLNVYDFLSSNGIEQLEEKVYPLEVMANIITIVGSIVGYIIFIYMILRQPMSFIWRISGEWMTWFLGFQHLPLFLFKRHKFQRFSIAHVK